MLFTKKQIQKASIGQLEDMLAEAAAVETTEARETEHVITERLEELESHG